MAIQPTTLRERSALQRQVREGLAEKGLESSGDLAEDQRNLEWLERLKSDGPAREVVFRTLRRNPSFADTPESLTNHDLVMTIEALLAEGLLPSFEKGLAPTSPNP